MQYGHKAFGEWVINDEEEAIQHIKYASVYPSFSFFYFSLSSQVFRYSRYEQGIQTFDTADVRAKPI